MFIYTDVHTNSNRNTKSNDMNPKTYLKHQIAISQINIGKKKQKKNRPSNEYYFDVSSYGTMIIREYLLLGVTRRHQPCTLIHIYGRSAMVGRRVRRGGPLTPLTLSSHCQGCRGVLTPHATLKVAWGFGYPPRQGNLRRSPGHLDREAIVPRRYLPGSNQLEHLCSPLLCSHLQTP